LGSLDYFELSKKEILYLTLKNNKRIVEMAMKEKYEETSHNDGK